jgi:multidrug efflux system outer membrane protein
LNTDGDWPQTQWWTSYHDPLLNQLVEQAIATAPAIATAEARLRTARESVRVAAAADGLRIDAKADISRQRLSDNGMFPPAFLGYHWYTQSDLGLQASYTFDWWHKQRDSVEAAIDQARAAQAEEAASRLALAASICDTYFGWQADQARLELLREQVTVLEHQRRVADARSRAQLEPVDTQYQLDGELAGIRQRMAAVEGSAKLRTVALAALLGRSPDELPALEPRALPAVQTRLPADVRIGLMARRPDLAASRWRVLAADKEVAVARAEFMPDISVNTLLALSSIDLGKLLEYGSRAPAMGVAFNLPIFDRSLNARYGARTAQLEAAISIYNETLVTAAREVATQTATLAQLDAQREQQRARVASAEKLLAVSDARVRQGLSDIRPQLAANETLLATRESGVDLEAAAISAHINLALALGGGFQETSDDQAFSDATNEHEQR